MNAVNNMVVGIISNCLTQVGWRIKDGETVRAKIELESIIATLKAYANSGYLDIGEFGVFREKVIEFAEVLNMPTPTWN
jgi:hypothetical protein